MREAITAGSTKVRGEGNKMLSLTEKTRRVRARRHAAGLCRYCVKPIAKKSRGTCEDHLRERRITPAETKWQPGHVGRPPEWAKQQGLA